MKEYSCLKDYIRKEIGLITMIYVSLLKNKERWPNYIRGRGRNEIIEKSIK